MCISSMGIISWLKFEEKRKNFLIYETINYKNMGIYVLNIRNQSIRNLVLNNYWGKFWNYLLKNRSFLLHKTYDSRKTLSFLIKYF